MGDTFDVAHVLSLTNALQYAFMSYLSRLLSALLVVAIGWAAQSPAQAQDNRKVLDQIAAVVGDKIILKSEVDQLVMTRLQQQSNASYSGELWMNALDQLVDREVLAARARADTTITVSDQQVEQQLDQQVQQIVQQVGSEAQVEQMYGKSIRELKEDFREDMRNQILAQQLRARKMQEIRITPSEIRTWFKKIPNDSLPELPTTVRLAHIVRYPKPSQEARDEAREIITAIRDSIVNSGASFEEMARRFSDDPGSASSGGRIQDVNLNDLVPEFAAIASRVPIGEVSQVFYNSSQSGYHIVRVNERTGNTVDFNHILIRVDQSNSEATEAIQYLQAVRDTLLNYDVPFALMARRHSEEQQSVRNGGRVIAPRSGQRDLVLDALGPSWKSTLDTMKVGEISKPAEVQLLNGERAYHIVKLQDRTPAHTVNLKTDYERIKQFALQDKRSREMRKWLDELRKETYVDIRVNPDELTAVRN